MKRSSNCVKKNFWRTPTDAANHYSIAQAFECVGEYEQALPHIEKSLVGYPAFTDSFTLAMRCLSKLERHDEAYEYAKRGINECETIQSPKLVVTLCNMLSYIPGFGALRGIDKMENSLEEKSLRQLNEFINWYENRQVS